MFTEIKHTHAEVESAYDAANATRTTGESKFLGMSYEEGVMAAFDWLYGRAEDSPMED